MSVCLVIHSSTLSKWESAHMKHFFTGLQREKLLGTWITFYLFLLLSVTQRRALRSFTCRHKQKAALRGQRGDFIGADERNQARRNGGESLCFTLRKWKCKHCVLTDAGSPDFTLI